MSKSIFSALFAAGIFLTISNQVSAQPVQANQKSSKTADVEFTQFKSDLGTEKSPLVVKIPQDKSKDDIEKEAYERGEKRELDRKTTSYAKESADYAYTNIYLTVGLLFVAFLQALLFFHQLKMMKTALIDSKNASEAAVIGASAAKESTDIARRAMIASERAYVRYSGISFFSHPSSDTGLIFWRFRSSWANSGSTPTRGLKVFVKFELLDDLMQDDHKFEYDFASQLRPIGLGPNEAINSGVSDHFGDALKEVQAGKKHLYVWGVAFYKSMFEESGEHVTKFCVKATGITGDPTLPYSPDKPFDIHFNIVGQHNCSDQDCLLTV
jgi:hypothetical protein